MFKWGNFKSSSGKILPFKIDCDDMTDEDWECWANWIYHTVGFRFRKVFGVPTGGLKFAEKLKPFCDKNSIITLYVDDVLTTGKSMEMIADKHRGTRLFGIVLYARGKCPDWIHPIFKMERGGL